MSSMLNPKLSRRRKRLLRVLDNAQRRRSRQYGADEREIAAFLGMEPSRRPYGQWKRYKRSVDASWAAEGYPDVRLVRSCAPWRRPRRLPSRA